MLHLQIRAFGLKLHANWVPLFAASISFNVCSTNCITMQTKKQITTKASFCVLRKLREKIWRVFRKRIEKGALFALHSPSELQPVLRCSGQFRNQLSQRATNFRAQKGKLRLEKAAKFYVFLRFKFENLNKNWKSIAQSKKRIDIETCF